VTLFLTSPQLMRLRLGVNTFDDEPFSLRFLYVLLVFGMDTVGRLPTIWVTSE